MMKNLLTVASIVALVLGVGYASLAREYAKAIHSLSAPVPAEKSPAECPMEGTHPGNTMACPVGKSNHACCTDVAVQGLGLHSGATEAKAALGESQARAEQSPPQRRGQETSE